MVDIHQLQIDFWFPDRWLYAHSDVPVHHEVPLPTVGKPLVHGARPLSLGHCMNTMAINNRLTNSHLTSNIKKRN